MLVSNDHSFGDLASRQLQSINQNKSINLQCSLTALELNKKIASQLLYSKVATLISILHEKVLSQKYKGFKYIQNSYNRTFNYKLQINCQTNILETIVHKIDDTNQDQRLQLLAKGFLNLLLKTNKKKTDKSTTKISNRNSDIRKIVELDKSKNHRETEVVKKENETLRKKKQSLKTNLKDFFNKMDKLLTTHETYLKK